MFILAFFIIVSLGGYLTTKLSGTSSDIPDSYEYTKNSSKLIGIILLTGIIGELLFSYFENLYWQAIGIYIILSIIIIILVSNEQQQKLTKIREDLIQVYSILQPLIDKKGSVENFNPLEAKFRLEYEKGLISKIIVPLDPNGFNEEIAMNCIMQCNKFLSNSAWVLEPRYEDRECDFIGTPKPPKIAMFPGSWLRPLEFIPIGVCGHGETGWTVFGCDNKIGRSMFKYDDGAAPGVKLLALSPHAIIGGISGSGKSIWLEQEIYD